MFTLNIKTRDIKPQLERYTYSIMKATACLHNVTLSELQLTTKSYSRHDNSAIASRLRLRETCLTKAS